MGIAERIGKLETVWQRQKAEEAAACLPLLNPAVDFSDLSLAERRELNDLFAKASRSCPGDLDLWALSEEERERLKLLSGRGRPKEGEWPKLTEADIRRLAEQAVANPRSGLYQFPLEDVVAGLTESAIELGEM